MNSVYFSPFVNKRLDNQFIRTLFLVTARGGVVNHYRGFCHWCFCALPLFHWTPCRCGGLSYGAKFGPNHWAPLQRAGSWNWTNANAWWISTTWLSNLGHQGRMTLYAVRLSVDNLRNLNISTPNFTILESALTIPILEEWVNATLYRWCIPSRWSAARTEYSRMV